jgi:DNA-binding IclR family transcriptional regulator
MEDAPQMSKAKPRPTLAVQKAMRIMDCLGEAGQPLSVSEIGHTLGLPRSTVYRLLATLAAGSYVTPDPSNPRGYRLGFKITQLANSLLESIELRQQARELLTELRDVARETVHLVVLDDVQVTYIDKVECSRAIRMHSAIGRRGLVHCTAVGKAILAFLPGEEAERILEATGLPSRTPHTITDREVFCEELERVRMLGYAVDNIENEDGIRCVGAPIVDHRGYPIAAISVSGPAYRLSVVRVRELSEAVVATASAISQRMGYTEETGGNAC